MESYKLVNNKEVQEKAVRLGYILTENANSKEIIVLDGSEKTVSFYRCKDYNNIYSCFKEITQADFLALPEPLKVGDWAYSCEAVNEFHFYKIAEIKEGEVYTARNIIIANADRFNKLTPEQIKVLGLEE